MTRKTGRTQKKAIEMSPPHSAWASAQPSSRKKNTGLFLRYQPRVSVGVVNATVARYIRTLIYVIFISVI